MHFLIFDSKKKKKNELKENYLLTQLILRLLLNNFFKKYFKKIELNENYLKRIKYKPDGPMVMGPTDWNCWADIEMI